MSEILDDMFDEALRFEQESDDTDEHCGEIVIQSSEFCALHAKIKELEALVQKMKCCNNCKHDQQEDHDPDWGCEGCHEGYTKWEAQQ